MSKSDSPGGGGKARGKKSRGAACPTCGAPSQHDNRPFCSKRCKDIDLGRWLRGSFRIPTEERPAEGTHEGEPSEVGPDNGSAPGDSF